MKAMFLFKRVLLFFCFLVISLPVSSDQIEEKNNFSVEHLIYSNQEMLTFDVSTYLAEYAPHLLLHAELISHWSGYTTVSPKILIALMEYQTGIVSSSYADELQMQKPFGHLSSKNTFAKQVYDIADQLAEMIYSKEPSSIAAREFVRGYSLSPLHELLASDNSQDDGLASVQAFNAVYERLFLQPRTAAVDNKALRLSGPPNDLLQLPYPLDKIWKFGGTHTNTGSGSYPMSSLDLYERYSGGWGSNVSNYWVVAAAAGRVKVHSSCFMEVVHTGGWSTTYYHLDNIQVYSNQQVPSNRRIANYANYKWQALCNGGSSTGPHVHFSLKHNGRYADLDNAALSGFVVHAGRYSYDTNCNHFWLEKYNRKHCARVGLRNRR